jgi:hypothetical protein
MTKFGNQSWSSIEKIEYIVPKIELQLKWSEDVLIAMEKDAGYMWSKLNELEPFIMKTYPILKEKIPLLNIKISRMITQLETCHGNSTLFSHHSAVSMSETLKNTADAKESLKEILSMMNSTHLR